MSRGGRGGRGGGRGGFGGSSRGGFGPSNLPPMGLTFADIQNMSREASELYPVRRDHRHFHKASLNICV